MTAILVVDDDAFARSFFEAALANAGYRVVMATSVDEGLRISAEQRFDIAIVDILMPERSGLDLIRILRQRGSRHASSRSPAAVRAKASTSWRRRRTSGPTSRFGSRCPPPCSSRPCKACCTSDPAVSRIRDRVGLDGAGQPPGP